MKIRMSTILGSRGSRRPARRIRPAGLAMLLAVMLIAGRAVLPSAQAQSVASSVAVRTNPGFQANSIPRNDDGSTNTAIPLGFTVDFFGERYSAAWINNNGNITFGGPLSTFTPEGLVASPLRIIAPFWADVDTRGPGSALVTYGSDVVNGRPAFGVNWVNVGYFGSHDDKLNSFQLVLIERTDIGPGNFDIEFNYDRILWETGDASGGRGGFGGTPASAGYSNGQQKPEGSFEILGSRRTSLFLDSNRNGLKYRTLNSNVRGRLVFFVRSGDVDCTYSVLTVDEPFPWQGGTGTVQVAAPGRCAWTAVSNSTFITINGETERAGSGDIEYVVTENRRAARGGTMTIAGQVIRVLQDGFITFSVTPPSLNISAIDGKFPGQVALRVEALRDPVSWAARVELIDGSASWRLSVTPATGGATVEKPAVLLLNLDPGFSPPVASLAEITVTDTVFGPSMKIPVILGMSQLGPRLQVSQSSFVFRAVQGGPAPPPQTLLLLNSGSDALNWSFADNGASWLGLSVTAGSAIAGSPLPASTSISVNPAGLAAGFYQAPLTINSEALNNPQLVIVSLQVSPPDAASSAEMAPAGLVFVGQQGQRAPQPQRLTVSNRGGGPLTFELETATESGGDWLVLPQRTGATDAGPASVPVAVNLANLGAGLHRGFIVGSFSTGESQITEVVVSVQPASSRPFQGGQACNRSGFSLVSSTVGSGSNLSVGFPQALQARLADTCGNPVNDASVFVDVNNSTIVLRPLGNGNFAGTWTPFFATPSVIIRFSALLPPFPLVERSFTMAVTFAPGEPAIPAIAEDGVVEGAGFTAGWPLAPGGRIAVFGSQFATEDSVANTIPLPRTLGGVRLRIGTEDAPLFSVGPNQIDALVPFSARPGDSVSVQVNAGGRWSAPQTYLILPARPGIYQTDGIARTQDGGSQSITPSNPARIGGSLKIFAAGLGLADPLPETGAAAPPSSTLHNDVQVTIGGVEVPVTYQGLAPGQVGVYQVDVLLNSGLPTGDEIPVVILQTGISSESSSSVTIPLRRPTQ